MATVLRHEFHNVKRPDVYKITPLGDVHLGAAACDENGFKRVIKEIEKEKNHYWIGTGDYCDFINMKDPRFSVRNLAKWIEREDMADLAKAQYERFTEMVAPIANKCLGLAKGNHETVIAKYFERAIYEDIVTRVKELGGFPPDQRLSLGYYGWIRLMFYRDKKRQTSSNIRINVHHGFVGGKLAGAKALNMQRWLWSHNADIVIFGHSHNQSAQSEAVEYIDKGDNIRIKVRKGLYGGSFLKSVHQDGDGSNTYSEEKGYFPLPHSIIPHIILTPRTTNDYDRIKMVT